jgi:hypothetical protein
MRARGPLLHLAALAVAVTVGAHVLMHIQAHPVAEPMAVHISHVGAASTVAAEGGFPHPTGEDHGHLMVQLCMAVLAGAALAIVLQRAPAISTLGSAVLVPVRRMITHQLRAPPPLLSGVDGGVLLRV